MPAPHVIIPLMEGLVSTMPTNASQRVATWVELCKAIMRQQALRENTDWEFAVSTDIDETGNVVRSGASTLYAGLIGTDSADAEVDWVVVTNATSNTLDGTAALDNTDFFVFELPAAATDGTEEFHSFVIPEGLVLGTGFTVAADGQDGANPAANDIRGWFLYRSA